MAGAATWDLSHSRELVRLPGVRTGGVCEPPDGELREGSGSAQARSHSARSGRPCGPLGRRPRGRCRRLRGRRRLGEYKNEQKLYIFLHDYSPGPGTTSAAASRMPCRRLRERKCNLCFLIISVLLYHFPLRRRALSMVRMAPRCLDFLGDFR